MTMLIDPRDDFVSRDMLFENPNVKSEDAFAIIFSLEAELTFFSADFLGNWNGNREVFKEFLLRTNAMDRLQCCRHGNLGPAGRECHF